MCEVDVTRLITDFEPSELSASIAERGSNAGPETWANSIEAATEPLEIANREQIRAFFREFGAWEADEIAAWSDTELDALVLQYAAGDLRELQSLAPGDGLGGIDWAEAEALANSGTCGGRLFPHDGRLFIYIGN